MHLKDDLHPRVRQGYWLAQRVIWAGMLLFVLLVLAGLCGTGLFSDATKSASTEGVDVEIDYQRIARMKRPQRLEITVRAPNAVGDQLSIAISNDYAEAISVRTVIPDADSTAVGPEGAIYQWTVEDWSSPLAVSIELQVEQWRRHEPVITVTAGESAPQAMTLQQFVYP
jgi:hypothetical protein